MQVDTLENGDIQAWPQPSPISYPERKSLISPMVTQEAIKEEVSTTVVEQEEQKHSVVEETSQQSISMTNITDSQISVTQ